MTGEDPGDLLRVATDAAEAAAEVLLAHRRRMRAGEALAVDTKTSATDPVSEADEESEQVLVRVITDARPDDGLLGEEGADRAGSSGLRWVVDPLDGTVNYLYGHVGWAVSVAVEALGEDGEWTAVAGIVLEPSTGTTYAAVRGGGATCDGRPLAVNDPAPLEMALVATGFAYDREHRTRQALVAASVLGAVRDLRRVGSAALDLCRVAAGQCDAYYEDSTQRWDWAAGALVAQEAGAVVTPRVTIPGHTGVIAAGPTLHPQLAALVGGATGPSAHGRPVGPPREQVPDPGRSGRLPRRP